MDPSASAWNPIFARRNRQRPVSISPIEDSSITCSYILFLLSYQSIHFTYYSEYFQHQLPEFDKMPESLVNTLQSCQTLRDVFHALHTHWTQQSGDQIQEYQIEVEHLQTKLEHIRAQNNVIALSMEESKSNSEQLSLLIGKFCQWLFCGSEVSFMPVVLGGRGGLAPGCALLQHFPKNSYFALVLDLTIRQ